MNNSDRKPLLFRKVQQGILLLTQHYLSGEVNNSMQKASGLRGCLEAVFYFRQGGGSDPAEDLILFPDDVHIGFYRHGGHPRLQQSGAHQRKYEAV